MNKTVRNFSYALIVRHAVLSQRSTWCKAPPRDIVINLRQYPHEWQSLLMKRSYKGREWDNFGGGSDPNETPVETLVRELKEESGLSVDKQLFVGTIRRPFKGCELVGHGFLVIPGGEGWFLDEPQLLCDRNEVERVGWFTLSDIHDGEPFMRTLGARVKAVLACDEDANCFDYISKIGIERCIKAGD